jgi:hypothetical protein
MCVFHFLMISFSGSRVRAVFEPLFWACNSLRGIMLEGKGENYVTSRHH